MMIEKYASGSRRRSVRRSVVVMSAGALLIAHTLGAAVAGPRDQAKRIHDRITGVPPNATVLANMESLISSNRALDAALVATENPAFYTVTLKNFATPWTNREQTVFAPLNDYTATVIGMVRDDVPFNTALSADLLYTVQASGLPAYSAVNNDHYEQAEANGVDLKAALLPATQSQLLGIPPAAAAGLMTTRASAAAFFLDGTNRAMFRFTLMAHMCKDLEELQDITLPNDRIRQDVSRSPGGDSRIYLNNCVGCHTGMEPMTQAFAHYDFDETQNRLVYDPTRVDPKYFNNADTFKPGYVTPDDRWDNYWRKGQNRLLGWSPQLPGTGNGAKSLGEELGNSEAFAHCQVEKVFKAVCFRAPRNSADRGKVDQITASFKSNGYKLKQVWAETAVYCMGD
ncbi:MAG TPA: hypothetical protein P5528_03390 [Steroidobacteraceae bacterium]|nr:hypothetical protein [Steroidobacteraceae bacterium]HRX88467.1 hypothetical protein [Steroidobacteraceae bacterium]